MFIDSRVVTPFPFNIPVWEALLCWSPLFNWETEAGEGVAFSGKERSSRGVLGLFPSPATPGFISLSLLADETVTLEITEPITHSRLESIHMLGAFFLVLVFLLLFCSARCEGWVFPWLFRSCGIQLWGVLPRMKYSCFRGWLGSFGYLCMHIYANPACCACSLHV